MKRNRNHLFVAFVTSAYAERFCSYSGIPIFRPCKGNKNNYFEKSDGSKFRGKLELQCLTEEEKLL